MPVHDDTSGFLSSVGTGGGGKFSRWKDAGSTVGWIHPRLPIADRLAHAIVPSHKPDDSGQMEIVNRRYNCAGRGCPLCALPEFAEKKLKDGVNPQEVVLDGGSEKRSYTWEALAGRLSGPVWMMNLGGQQQEHLIAWIPAVGRSAQKPVEIVTAGTGLGMAIKRVITSSQEQWGDEQGDPRKNPFPIKLIYDKGARQASQKYNAVKIENPEMAPIDDEVRNIMKASAEELGIDFRDMVREGSASDMLNSLQATWVSRFVPPQEFFEFVYGKGGRPQQQDAPPQESRPPAQETQKTGGGYCPECGKPVAVGKKFCGECGAKLEGSTSPAPDQPNPGPGTAGMVTCWGEDCKKTDVPTELGRCKHCGRNIHDVPR